MVYHTRKTGLRGMFASSALTAYLGIAMSSLFAGVELHNIHSRKLNMPAEEMHDQIRKDEFVESLVPVIQKLHSFYYGKSLDEQLARKQLAAHYEASLYEGTPLLESASMCFFVESKGNPYVQGNKYVTDSEGNKRPNPNPAQGYCQVKVETAKEIFDLMKEEGYKDLPKRFDARAYRYNIELQARSSQKYLRLGIERQERLGRDPDDIKRLAIRNYQKGMYSSGTNNTSYVHMVLEGTEMFQSAVDKYRSGRRMVSR
ncbi:hypothetical protein JW711_00325 [Candidatus Woesearchaeota archaeon]|nr:hypothetical protein [Candidatus Woesearchaeota archaeon]